VPVAFRTVLAEQAAHDIILRPSSHSPCIDVWPKPAFQAEVRHRVGDADPFRRAYDVATDDLTIDVFSLHPDAEGRIVLPKDLLEQVPLDADVKFLGRDKFFQIWPARIWAERRARQKAEALARNEDPAA
jgi:MraZ protein